MNKLLEFLRPIDTLIWNYFVKSKFILFCGGGKSADPVYVEPRDMGEDARSYLEAITDPELVGKQLDAEKEFGPQFDLVSLSRTQIMLEGIDDPKESQAYLNATARRIALQAKKKALEEGQETMSQEDIDRQIEAILGPAPNETYEYRGRGNYKQTRENPEYVAYQERKAVLSENYSSANNSDLAEVEGELAGVIETITQIENQPAQKGLIEMAEDTAKAYDKIIADSNTFKRERDILDMEYFGQKATDATRASDPYSTGIAEKTTELSDKLTDRALADTEQSEERMKMGRIADRQAARIDDLEKISEDLRTPKENEELNNLKNLRDQQQKSLLDPSLAKALDPTLSEERRDLRTIADQSMLAAEGPTGVAFDRQQANQQSLANMSMDSATSATARANNPMLAEGRAELGSLADQAQGFAMNPTSNTERAQLGDMAQQSRDFADSLMAEAQNPALPNAERQRLINMSQKQEQRANELYSRAGDVSAEQQVLLDSATAMRARGDDMFSRAGDVSAEQQGLRDRAQELANRSDEMFAQSGRVTPEQEELRRQSQELFGQADQLMATAGDVSAEQQAIRDRATSIQQRAQQLFAQSEQAPSAEKLRLQQEARNLQARSDQLFTQADTEASALRERAGQVTPEQQQLRNQASSMQQRAQSLFEQAESAPSAQKRELQNAARDMMERGKGLFEQSKRTSLKRAQAGSLAQLSAVQAKQLTADATGPLSSQRRRLAEQAARQQGLRTGRIGDNAQLAAELLNREESRAALRDEARKSRDLAFTQASTYATDAANDSNQLRTSALGYETGGFDRARGVDGDIDAQRLALLQEGRLTEANALAASRGIEGDIASREAALLQESRLTGQGLRSDALTAQATASAQARGVEGDIDAQRLALIGEGRLAEANALEGSIGIEGQISDQEIARQGRALDARRFGLSAGTTLEGQIADQEIARQGGANQLGLATATEARGIEGMISDQEIARTGRALEASQLGMQEGRDIGGQISDQETSRNAEARATAGQSFDMGREIQTDLDDLTETRRDQALDARGDARDATTDLTTIDKGFRDEAEERQQALLDRDESLRKEARLEREAASLDQRGLYEQARGLREEAAEAREDASDAVQTVADIDASFRAEGRQNIGDAIGLGAGLAEAEENLRQTNLDEQAAIRGEISGAESTAFANQGVLANFDSAIDQNRITNALDSSKTSFNMNQAVGDNSMLAGTSTAPTMGATSVAGAPGVSQGFQPLFQGAIGTGINMGQVNRANDQAFENTKAQIAADNRASSRSTFGTLVKAGAAMLPIPGASVVTGGIN